MEKLTPIKWPTWSTRQVRVIWHIFTVIVASLVFTAGSITAADAGPRRARLSSDLSQHLTSNANGSIEVIVSGTPDKIERLRSRYGLRIRKSMESGAVFSVSRQTLDALSQDEVTCTGLPLLDRSLIIPARADTLVSIQSSCAAPHSARMRNPRFKSARFEANGTTSFQRGDLA